MFYFRDISGREVDLLLQQGEELKAIEIKTKFEIDNIDVFKNLSYLRQINPKIKPFLIYLGEKEFDIDKIKILPWFNLKKIFI